VVGCLRLRILTEVHRFRRPLSRAPRDWQPYKCLTLYMLRVAPLGEGLRGVGIVFSSGVGYVPSPIAGLTRDSLLAVNCIIECCKDMNPLLPGLSELP
jgi:hypothetical protein